jgi:hypothetical protein
MESTLDYRSWCKAWKCRPRGQDQVGRVVKMANTFDSVRSPHSRRRDLGRLGRTLSSAAAAIRSSRRGSHLFVSPGIFYSRSHADRSHGGTSIGPGGGAGFRDFLRLPSAKENRSNRRTLPGFASLTRLTSRIVEGWGKLRPAAEPAFSLREVMRSGNTHCAISAVALGKHYLRRDTAVALTPLFTFRGDPFTPVPSPEKLPTSFITLRTTPSIRLSMVRYGTIRRMHHFPSLS